MSNLNKKTKDELLAMIFEQQKTVALVNDTIEKCREARENVAIAREQNAKSAVMMNGFKEAMKLEQEKIMQLRKDRNYWRKMWLYTTLTAVAAIILILCL